MVMTSFSPNVKKNASTRHPRLSTIFSTAAWRADPPDFIRPFAPSAVGSFNQIFRHRSSPKRAGTGGGGRYAIAPDASCLGY
jgi:hypothetical protein